MEIRLGGELGDFVESRVASGKNANAEDVVRQALVLMKEQEEARAAEIAAFNEEIDARLKEMDEGGIVDADEVIERLRRRSAERRRTAA